MHGKRNEDRTDKLKENGRKEERGKSTKKLKERGRGMEKEYGRKEGRR
jgi:hypothetical protein